MWVGGRTQHQHCQTACSAATHINRPIIYLSWVFIFGKRLFQSSGLQPQQTKDEYENSRRRNS